MLMRYLRVLSFCFLNFMALSIVEGQSLHFNKEKIFIEAGYNFGYLMPQRDHIAYLLRDHLQAFQISIGTNNLENQYWQRKHNFPRTGFGLYYTNLGNDKVFGSMTAIFVSFEKNFLNHNWPVNLSNNIQVGPCYVSKQFDVEKNNFNIVMGSAVNIYLHYSLCTSFLISKSLRLKIGAGYSHISNGDLAEPNSGLNMFNFRTGIIFLPGKPSYNYDVAYEKPEMKKDRFDLILASGMKEMSRFDKNNYWVYSITADYCRMITPMNGFGLGFDIYYDFATTAIHKLENKPKPKTFEMLHYTAHVTWQNQLGRFIIVVQPGLYVYKSFDRFGKMNNKAGFRYQVTEKLLFSAMIKGHWLAYADIIEWGIGYEL